MSEPVIKAKAWMCPECHATETNPKFVGTMENHEGDCHGKMEPLYGPGALVRVACNAIAEWNASSMIPFEIELAANDLVDRLTKGET